MPNFKKFIYWYNEIKDEWLELFDGKKENLGLKNI